MNGTQKRECHSYFVQFSPTACIHKGAIYQQKAFLQVNCIKRLGLNLIRSDDRVPDSARRGCRYSAQLERNGRPKAQSYPYPWH